jgi:hypothetical protein
MAADAHGQDSLLSLSQWIKHDAILALYQANFTKLALSVREC